MSAGERVSSSRSSSRNSAFNARLQLVLITTGEPNTICLENASMIRRLLGRLLSQSQNSVVEDWVVPVDQPMIWLNQMARCGGTMTLRLFDGHPEMHVHPRPMPIRWPQSTNTKNVQKIFDHFSLQQYHVVGWQKVASNQIQSIVPVYFDQNLYKSIFRCFKFKNGRELINAASTARFNAWRNYQSLYGQKKFQLLHTTIWSHLNVKKTFIQFFSTFPDGYSLFLARSPEDWIASISHLDKSNRPKNLENTEDYIKEYIDILNLYFEVYDGKNADRMLLLEFDDFVKNSTQKIAAICDTIGISYHPCFETTTTNGVLLQANSSHVKSEKGAPDPSVIGKGAAIREELKGSALFSEASALFRRARDQSI